MFLHSHMSPEAEDLGENQNFFLLTHTNKRGGSYVPDSQNFNT